MVSTQGGALVLRTTIACGVFITVAVILRLMAQWRNNRKFHKDDWWIVATLVPSYAMLAVGMLSKALFPVCFEIELTRSVVTIGGGGKHISTLDEADLVLFLKVSLIFPTKQKS